MVTIVKKRSRIVPKPKKISPYSSIYQPDIGQKLIKVIRRPKHPSTPVGGMSLPSGQEVLVTPSGKVVGSTSSKIFPSRRRGGGGGGGRPRPSPRPSPKISPNKSPKASPSDLTSVYQPNIGSKLISAIKRTEVKSPSSEFREFSRGTTIRGDKSAIQSMSSRLTSSPRIFYEKIVTFPHRIPSKAEELTTRMSIY